MSFDDISSLPRTEENLVILFEEEKRGIRERKEKWQLKIIKIYLTYEERQLQHQHLHDPHVKSP
jgi:hypothetical protein